MWIAAAGGLLVVLGLLTWLGGMAWCGRLPGDIRIEQETVRVYLPLGSMLVVSLVLTVLINVLRRSP